MEIINQKTRTLRVRENGRSSDIVSPNFIYGCLASCEYCYIRRNPRLRDKTYVNINVDQILGKCNEWVEKQPWPKESNQTDPELYTIDIGCSTDIPLMYKHQDWNYILEYFVAHSKFKPTFATKYPTLAVRRLPYVPDSSVRIRTSLMPQTVSSVVEPGTNIITHRIESIAKLREKGYEVHINFSPIVVCDGWEGMYIDLFNELNAIVPDRCKSDIKCECIFLTHNHDVHEYNLSKGKQKAEDYLWTPWNQEDKISKYGSPAVRYKWSTHKKDYISRFKALTAQIIPWCDIRYIF